MKTDCNCLLSSHKFLNLKQILHRMADNEVTAKRIVRKFHGNEVYNFQFSVFEILLHLTSLFVRTLYIHVNRKRQILSI